MSFFKKQIRFSSSTRGNNQVRERKRRESGPADLEKHGNMSGQVWGAGSAEV